MTPIGLYYRRRNRLLETLADVLAYHPPGAAVLDFGCGDGFYSLWSGLRYPELEFCGCDISQSMIARAERAKLELRLNVDFQVSNGSIPFAGPFDTLLVLAVFAHISDERAIREIVVSFADRVDIGGKVVLFEMTAPRPRVGATWARRTPEFYCDIFRDIGFRVVRIELLSYPTYNLIGRYLFVGLTKVFFRGNYVKANGNAAYRLLSDVFMQCSALSDQFLKSGEGNTVFVFERID